MEEHVGGWWHDFITRHSEQRHPEAAVALADIQQLLGIWFRALGGDGGLEIATADATLSNARRSLLQRMAGTQRKTELAWRDENALRLPPVIDIFPNPQLNRDLYLWLGALAAMDDESTDEPWFRHNQRISRRALERFPGLRDKYLDLVQAHLEQRKLGHWPADEIAQEQAIRRALIEPGSMDALPPSRRMPVPVPLWLHPNPPQATPMPAAEPPEDPGAGGGKVKELEEVARKQTEKAETQDSDRGLITVRMENIFSWGEHVNVDRGTEDEDNDERADEVARDLDKISVTRNGKAAKTRIRFDLDLPAEAEDDEIISDDLMLPEWDWKKRQLLADHCRVVELVARDAQAIALPKRLDRTAAKLRSQFQALAPARVWHRARPDGEEVDLDAYLRYRTDRASGCQVAADNLYRQMNAGARDLACLLLADLSLSTDTWVNDESRVLDVIQDSLYLFAESLAATGDQFGIYGFSSRKRDPIRIHTIKTFEETYNGRIRGRIRALTPGYYTRLGAGIRYAAERLKDQGAGRRLLLILTDGKPNDLDQYEGRYGIEDTRHAIQSVRNLGFHPFCVTIDQKGNDYLPHLFGSSGYVVIRDPMELPGQLPLLYARLTAQQH
ncbi:nitric-oxide reductase NorD protein [Thiolapillus brandeum]|uniref:Nitric-oxide reductase NorD protein n=2 Tax=Thiolapillus brandeum TaxID=1076588 RepID=A0A7U6GK46_9GAMM|nr:nitric-oxide reductase NorD protein [Thiolapillus brandeum]